MSEWFVSKGGKTHGPFSPQQLKQLAATAKINRETEVRLGPDGKWVTANNVRGLFDPQTAIAVPAAAAKAISKATPPPPPQFASRTIKSPIPTAVARDSSPGEKELLKVHPSVFRNQPVRCCMLILLAAAGCVTMLLGVVVGRGDVRAEMCIVGALLAVGCGLSFLLLWLKYQKASLIVTDKRTTLRFGLLSRYVKEVRHSDVRMLIVKQGFLQRLLGVGQISVASAATGESDIVIAGVPNPEQIKITIDNLRN
jgi:membrane protein YdbS with pleckstrin-like domain